MTIPKKIYLHIVDDEGNILDPMKDEVTWCWDKINDNDVEYEIVLTPRAVDFAPRCPKCNAVAGWHHEACEDYSPEPQSH